MAEEPTKKQLGDAGEHLVLAELTFAGFPATLMPDNWPDYDLIFNRNGKTYTVQVKTCGDFTGTRNSYVCNVELSTPFDYLAIVEASSRKIWLIPKRAVKRHGKHPKPTATWKKIRIQPTQLRTTGVFHRYFGLQTLSVKKISVASSP